MNQRKEVQFKIGRVYPPFFFSKRNTKKRYHRTLWIICQLLNELLLWNVKKGMLKKGLLGFLFFIKLIYAYFIFPLFLIIFNRNPGIHQKNQIHEMKEL